VSLESEVSDSSFPYRTALTYAAVAGASKKMIGDVRGDLFNLEL